jgi:hypothetical protein
MMTSEYYFAEEIFKGMEVIAISLRNETHIQYPPETPRPAAVSAPSKSSAFK